MPSKIIVLSLYFEECLPSLAWHSFFLILFSGMARGKKFIRWAVKQLFMGGVEIDY